MKEIKEQSRKKRVSIEASMLKHLKEKRFKTLKQLRSIKQNVRAYHR